MAQIFAQCPRRPCCPQAAVNGGNTPCRFVIVNIAVAPKVQALVIDALLMGEDPFPFKLPIWICPNPFSIFEKDTRIFEYKSLQIYDKIIFDEYYVCVGMTRQEIYIRRRK